MNEISMGIFSSEFKYKSETWDQYSYNKCNKKFFKLKQLIEKKLTTVCLTAAHKKFNKKITDLIIIDWLTSSGKQSKSQSKFLLKTNRSGFKL